MTIFITRTGAALVNVSEAKEHCRIIGTDDDAYLTALISAATSWAENDTDCILITSTIVQTYHYARYIYHLDKQPVSAITSVEFQDSVEWNNFTDYRSYRYQHGYSQITLNTLPNFDRTKADYLRITYTAMLQRDVAVAKQLVLMLVSQMYEHRELEVTGTIVAKVQGYEHLAACLRPGGLV